MALLREHRGGTLERYAGDGAMVEFNDPIEPVGDFFAQRYSPPSDGLQRVSDP
jgi:class 3 adenylate cyclase